MARCARPGCNHLKRKHVKGFGVCRVDPSGHCEHFVDEIIVVPPPSPCDGIKVTGSIQDAIDTNPPDTTFCLSGSYSISTPLRPKVGQRFVGPAVITAGGFVSSAFDLKAAKAVGASLVNLDVSGFVESSVKLWEGVSIIGGRYHHNLTNGLGGGFEYSDLPVTLMGVEIDNNGSEELLGVSSGGVKIARLGGIFLVDNCNIHDNLGVGVWADVQCAGEYRIINNVITHNSRKGVHYEKSGASDEFTPGGGVCIGCNLPVVEGLAYIANNVVTNNGWEGREHSADGGIVNVSSRNMIIENNTTSGNHRAGIFLKQDGRTDGEKHGWQVEAIVRGNTTPDGIIGCDLPGVTCE